MVTFISQCFDNISNRYGVRHVKRGDNSSQFPLHMEKILKNQVEADYMAFLRTPWVEECLIVYLPLLSDAQKSMQIRLFVSVVVCLQCPFACLFADLFVSPLNVFHMISRELFYFNQSYFPEVIPVAHACTQINMCVFVFKVKVKWASVTKTYVFGIMSVLQ